MNYIAVVSEYDTALALLSVRQFPVDTKCWKHAYTLHIEAQPENEDFDQSLKDDFFADLADTSDILDDARPWLEMWCVQLEITFIEVG